MTVPTHTPRSAGSAAHAGGGGQGGDGDDDDDDDDDDSFEGDFGDADALMHDSIASGVRSRSPGGASTGSGVGGLLADRSSSRIGSDAELPRWARHDEGSTVWDAAFNFTNSIVGAGIIGLPYAFLQSGFVSGLVLLVGLAWLVDWTVLLLVHDAKLAGQSTYQGLIAHCFGKRGLIAVSVFQFVFAYGAMCAYTVIIGDTLPTALAHLLPSGSLLHGLVSSRSTMITLCTLFVSLPLSMLRDISGLSKTSAVSLLMILFIVIAVAVEAFQAPAASRGDPLLVWTVLRGGIFQAIGVISFAFVCHHNTLMIYGSLKKPTMDRFAVVTHLSTGSSLLLCIVLACGGYAAFTDKTRANILMNLDPDSWLVNVARLFFGMNMFLTFPLECFVCREVVFNYWFMDESAMHEDVSHRASGAQHVAVTLALVLSSLAIALSTCSLGFVLELTGGLAATVLAYILPAACFLKLASGPVLSAKKLGPVLCIGFGFAVMCLSTVLSIRTFLLEPADRKARPKWTMYFSHDVLSSRKKNSLAVVWLAATLGERSSYKKLGRKEVNGVNVIQACSNLMMGVARVHAHQTTFFYGDVNSVFLRLKRAFSPLQKEDIDLAVDEARPEQITVSEPVDDLLLEPYSVTAMLALGAQAGRVDYSESAYLSFGSGGSNRRATLLTPEQLHSNGLDGSSSAGGGASYGSANGSVSLPGNLHADMPDTPLAARGRQSLTGGRDGNRPETGSVASGPISSTQRSKVALTLPQDPLSAELSAGAGAGDAIDLLMPEFEGMQQDDFDLFADFPTEMHQKQDAGPDPMFMIDDNFDFGFEEPQPQRSQDDVWVAVPVAQNGAAPDRQGSGGGANAAATLKSKQVHRKRNLFDEAISLPDEEIARQACARTSVQRRANETRAPWRADHSYVVQLMRESELPTCLGDFWDTAVLGYFDQAASSPQKRIRIAEAVEQAERGRSKARKTRRGQADIAGSSQADVAGVAQFDYDNFDIGLVDPYPDAFEMGRDANAAGVEAGVSPKAAMPWHVPSVTGSTVSGQSGAVLVHRRGGVRADPGSGRADARSRKMRETFSSLGDLDTPLRRVSTGGAGVGGVGGEHGASLPGSGGFSANGGDSSAENPFAGGDSPGAAVYDLPVGGTSPERREAEALSDSSSSREAAAFLGYIRSIMSQARTDTVNLFDILEHVHSRAVASQAFFNVLDLATKALVRVQQDEPHGDVQIRLARM
ncbi:hypothetical protein HK105_200309 [Polyrhizophydium stewartii]|uniref:Amino acid transporter transmembrane domain-containing protein n=1 Tax=Polyrhizophydium stewartii TaxID=2732419 RepID=A0ABR4NL46_9FUNG